MDEDIDYKSSTLHKAGKQGGPPCFTTLKFFDVGLKSFDVGVDHTHPPCYHTFLGRALTVTIDGEEGMTCLMKTMMPTCLMETKMSVIHCQVNWLCMCVCMYVCCFTCIINDVIHNFGFTIQFLIKNGSSLLMSIIAIVSLP